MPSRLPIRPLLNEMIDRWMPGFTPVPDAKPGYWFRRPPLPRLFALVVIVSSAKESCFGVNVVSSFFPTWNRQYGTHQMRSATGLPNLRLGSKSIPMEQSFYRHDGTESSVRETVEIIGEELRRFALPFFALHAAQADADPLVQAGLAWLGENKYKQTSDLNTKKQPHDPRGFLGDPRLEELKSVLRLKASKLSCPKRQRQETAILALDLLAYADKDLS
jgi:hypothetical protein